MSNKGKKYLTKFTPKQQKFIDQYTSKFGLLSARDCAIRAGYDPGSAHTRANELLDWRKNPDVVEEINARQIANREIWLIDKEKHLANLTRIQNEKELIKITDLLGRPAKEGKNILLFYHYNDGTVERIIKR